MWLKPWQWKHCIAWGIDCFTAYLAPQTEIFSWELNILIEDANHRDNHTIWIFEDHCHLLDSILTFDLPNKIIHIGDLLRWDEYNFFSVSD